MGGFTPAARSEPTIVTTLRDPGTTVGQRVIADVRDQLVLVRPSAAPFTFFTKRFRKREVHQYSYDWLTKDAHPHSATVASAATSGGTSIVVSSGEGTRFPVNALVLNRNTRERFLVTAITTDTLTATRGIGSTAQAMSAGDPLEILNTGHEDGASRGDLKSTKEEREWNMTQIVRNAYGWTGRQMNTSMYGGSDVKTERAAQAVEHAMAIENMLLFGTRHTMTGANGKLQTFSGGAEYFIKTNIWDVQGNEPSGDLIVEVLEEFLRHGKGGYEQGMTKKKFGFFSPRWMTKLSKLKSSHLEMTVKDTSWDIRIVELVTPHGTLMCIEDPILSGPEHGGWGFIIDPNHCFYVYHKGRDTKLLDNRQANDVDGEIEEYLTDCGSEIQLEFAHGIWKGLAGF